MRLSAGRRPVGAVALALVSALALAGCSSNRHATVEAKNDRPKWNWEFYPPLPRMRIATLPSQLLPKSSITIHSPLVGMLRVYVDQPQTNLPSGFVWAEFEPALFAAEEKALQEARLKLEERERLQLELEYPRQKARVQRELEEAQRQLRLLSLLATNPALAKLTFNVNAQNSVILKPEALTKAQLESGLLEQTLGYLQSTNLAVLGIDLQGQRSDLERRKLEFERRQAQAQLKMPFDGQLTIQLPLTQDVYEYPVNQGQELAVARDLNLVRARIALSNPAWAGIPTENLTAILRLSNGEELQAPFIFQKIERIQLREESVYYFQFTPEHAKAAGRLIGTDLSCELWLTLPRPARIVPKLALILNHPATFQSRSWAQGVAAAWPGARVLVEGQTELAILLPNDAMSL